jgi:hypothetical protein
LARSSSNGQTARNFALNSARVITFQKNNADEHSPLLTLFDTFIYLQCLNGVSQESRDELRTLVEQVSGAEFMGYSGLGDDGKTYMLVDLDSDELSSKIFKISEDFLKGVQKRQPKA